MTISSGLRLKLFLWCLLLGGVRLGAQDFGLTVTSAPGAPVVNSSITFTLNLTNSSGLGQTNVFVTNTLPVGMTFLSATQAFGGFTNIGRVQTFFLDFMLTNEATVLSIVARPTTFGTFTNVTIVFATNAVSVTNVHQFTVNSAAANLAVGLSGFASGVLSNDLTSYTLSATNLGPSAAPNVVISNLLPAGIRFLSITPSNSTVSFASNLLTIRLASMSSGSVTNYRINIQPTNAGSFEFTAGISAPGLLDTNTANNTVTGTLAVGDFLTGSLIATFVSGQVYNPQTGLMQQTIRLTNEGESPVASARIMVIGLTNLLYNAVGTNSGSPFVAYPNALAPAEFVDLILEYFVPTRLPVPDPTLLALEVPAFTPGNPAGVPVQISRLLLLAPGTVMLEFGTVPGKSYTVFYSDNPSFTTAHAAQPAIPATADRTQWIDSGPPKTSTPGASRFYRAIENH